MTIDTDFHLRRARKRIKLKEVSEATGINISLLSQYETGKKTPGLKNIIKIDEFLKTQGV